MFDKFFEKYPDYQIIEKPTVDKINQYNDLLPKEIMWIWGKYGFGIFAEGYLRIIDPDSFRKFTDQYVVNTGFNYIPIAVSAFGDLWVWIRRFDSFLNLYDYRHNTYKMISTGTGMDLLFDIKFTDSSYIWSKLNCPNYLEVKTKLGVPAYNQCYGYFPLLALGGKESVDNLQIVDLQVHMDLMAQVSGPL